MAHTAAEILCRDQFYGGQAGQRQTCRPGGASSTTTTNLSHQPHLINLISKKNTTIKHRPSSINHQSPTSLINHQQSPPTFLINLTSSPHQHYTLFLIKIQPPIMNIPHQPPPSLTFLINLTSSPLSTINLFSGTTFTKHYPVAFPYRKSNILDNMLEFLGTKIAES